MPVPGATGAMAYPASAAQAQAFAAQQFHAAMMQRMAAAQQQVRAPCYVRSCHRTFQQV